MSVDGVKTLDLRDLVDRADRARAQALANRESFERAMSRARTFEPNADCRSRNGDRPRSHAAADALIQELRDTVDGLMKRLESQAPIEQAKGIIMAQTHCDPDQAFEILRRASQRSNTKLRLLAQDLVAKTCRTDGAPTDTPKAGVAH